MSEIPYDIVPAAAVASLGDDARRRIAGYHLSNPEAEGVKLRGNARPTSRAAAKAAMPRSGTQRWRVLMEIMKSGDVGRTDDEIILNLNMLHQSVGPRRLELEEGGWIEDSGEKRKTRMNNPAIVWKLTESGRAALFTTR